MYKRQQYSRALHNLSEGLYKLGYVAPERLSTENFRTAVENLNSSLIAVDEAHCVSQCGQDFRPDYLKIAEFAESLKNRPTIGAFTQSRKSELLLAILKLEKGFAV